MPNIHKTYNMDHDKKLDKLKTWAETEDKKEKNTYIFPIAVIGAIGIGIATILYRSYNPLQANTINNTNTDKSKHHRRKRRH